ncbi:MAG: TfoX/Sxy family protein [Comamonadaceae bacterium]|nr:TfoX/Sxy family protein [Comamonadaceae bacterium]
MPARPIADATLHLINAVRAFLARRDDVDERTLFGSYCFFVDGKLCIGVKGDELLLRLPPLRHGEFQEMQNTRELSPGGGMQGYFWVEPNGYATRAQWHFWLEEALAYNPQAKATPPRKKAPGAGTKKKNSAQPANKKHSIFDAED